jgi:hypothetical protein
MHKVTNTHHEGRRGLAVLSHWRPALHIALAAGLFVCAVGCTRSFYRKRADNEVSEVLAQKDRYPMWAIMNWHAYPNPLARFGDPTDPDHPPKPPDDPAAYDLSPNPQHPPKAGVERVEGTGYLELIAQWDRENRAARAKREAEEGGGQTGEPPIAPVLPSGGPLPMRAAETDVVGSTPRDVLAEATSRTSLDITGRPTYLMTLDQAAELATINNREYQDRRESLYLAALPVTAERFAFVAQFFAAGQAIRELAGRTSIDGRTNNWQLNSGTGLAKLLPTGALLLLNFSNKTVFNFFNPKKTISTSTLNFDAIQPLLRGGSKAVTLEPLTQAERTLLYQIRNYARFRKELYVFIASNNGGSIAGGSFQPVGVLSSGGGGGGGGGGSGLSPGTFPIFSTVTNALTLPPGPAGSQSLTTAITPSPSGYLNTMLQNIQVYIDKENISVLSTILERYRGLLEGDIVGPLQVQSVEQQLLSGRSSLLTDQQQYLDAIDSFKLEIGVPTQLSLEMDDSELRPLMNQFRRSRAITEDEQNTVMEASKLITLADVPRVRAQLLRLAETSPLVRGTPFATRIRARLAVWEKLSDKELKDRLDAIRKETQALLDHRTDLQNKGQNLSPAEEARLRELGSQADLGNYERVLRKYEADYLEDGKPKVLTPVGERRRITQFRDVISFWQKVLVEARDDRWAAVRKSWPDLPRCCVDGVDLIRDDLTRSEEAAGQHALINRLDLMNVRAQVVDAWRQLRVFANALLGIFNVEYSLSSVTPPGKDRPLDIGGSGNAHHLIMNLELPIVRIAERNNYRTTLIAYQRNRRALQEAEDLAVKAVRAEIHLLRVYAENYKIQQRQLELAYLTIDSSLESLLAPTRPTTGAGAAAAAAGQDGPAALTQQLLTAQRTLPTAQNALLTVWINYLDTRLQLYRDLELMPIDARGVWIDEVRPCDCGDPEQPAGSDNQSGRPERLPEPKPEPSPGSERLPKPKPEPSPGP